MKRAIKKYFMNRNKSLQTGIPDIKTSLPGGIFQKNPLFFCHKIGVEFLFIMTLVFEKSLCYSDGNVIVQLRTLYLLQSL